MSDDKIKIGGLEIPVVSDEQADECDFLVCSPLGPSPFDDNLIGACCKCGVTVMYRWHAPRKPKRICLDCCITGKAEQ